MKYWLLTTEYPPFYGGGIGTYCSITASALVQHNIDVTVFIPDNSIKTWQIDKNHASPSIVKFNPDFGKQSYSLGYLANLSYSFACVVREFITKEGEPDFIEAQEYQGIAYFLQQFALTGIIQLHRCKIIITLHSPAFLYLDYNQTPTYSFPEYWVGVMEKNVIRAADILIAPTRFIVKEISEHLNLASKTIHYIPNPFSQEINTALSSNFTKGKIKFAFYGKLSVQKGIFKLLSYFKLLWQEGYDFQLILIGGTDIVFHPERRSMLEICMEQYAEYINKEQLIIIGKVHPDQLEKHLDGVTAVIIPSIVDNMPYALLECMALKKIVITSIQGGQSETIEHRKNGFTFDHNKPEGFKKLLLEVTALKDDERSEITANAYKKIQEYNPACIVPEKLKILEKYRVSPPARQIQYPFLYEDTGKICTKETSNDLLSVVIPFFNMEHYLEECLHSIYQSNYPLKEVIVVNDGSNSRSSKTLHALKEKYNFILTETSNNGVAHARNTGAKIAKGRFLAFLDADDKVSTSYYTEAIHILKQYSNVHFVGCWVKYFEGSSQTWPTFNPEPPYLLVHNSVNSSSLVYERSSFLNFGQHDKDVMYGIEDYESVINLKKNNCNGVVIPKEHFMYRVRKKSMIRGITREKWLYSYKYITHKHKEIYQKFSVDVFNILNSNGPAFSYDNPTQSKPFVFTINLNGLFKRIQKTYRQYPIAKKILLKIYKLKA